MPAQQATGAKADQQQQATDSDETCAEHPERTRAGFNAMGPAMEQGKQRHGQGQQYLTAGQQQRGGGHQQ
ncbi:hypothetical protein D3C85_1866850 [compost metagenome]